MCHLFKALPQQISCGDGNQNDVCNCQQGELLFVIFFYTNKAVSSDLRIGAA